MEAIAPNGMDQGHRQEGGREELKNIVQNQISAKEHEIRRMKMEISGVKWEVIGVKEEIIGVKEEIRGVKLEIRRVEMELVIASGKEVRSALDAKLQILRQHIISREQHIICREQQTSSREQQIINREQQISNREQQIISLREEIKSRGQQLVNLQQERMSLQSMQADPLAFMLQQHDPMEKMIADVTPFEHFPGVEELGAFLETSPLRSGFPISSHHFQRLSFLNLQGLFVREDQHHLCKRLDCSLSKVLEPPPTGSTEDSFHQFWDELVNDYVQLFCPQRIDRDRNTSRDPSTGNFRPDVVGIVSMQWALWRGVEKSPSTAGDPKKELLDTLTWVYGDIPYILAYHARGTLVTLDALYMKDGHKTIKILCSFDLSTLAGRVHIILACLNVARLLHRLGALCEDYSVEEEFKEIPESHGKRVQLFGASVKKSYRAKHVFDRVLEVYERIRACPNAERAVSSMPNDAAGSHPHSIVFEPRCEPSRRVKQELELVRALECVARALAWLHERGIMHRDIRWPNVGYYQEEWYLLGFDEACSSPQSQAHQKSACPERHAAESCNGAHDCSVDIWGIGHLMSSSGVLGLSSELVDLQRCCLAGNPSLRPSAKYCYEKLSSLIRDGLV